MAVSTAIILAANKSASCVTSPSCSRSKALANKAGSLLPCAAWVQGSLRRVFDSESRLSERRQDRLLFCGSSVMSSWNASASFPLSCFELDVRLQLFPASRSLLVASCPGASLFFGRPSRGLSLKANCVDRPRLSQNSSRRCRPLALWQSTWFIDMPQAPDQDRSRVGLTLLSRTAFSTSEVGSCFPSPLSLRPSLLWLPKLYLLGPALQLLSRANPP